MRALPPITITPALLTSTNVAEPSTGETAWNSATAYAVGDQAISTTTHRTYECNQANTNEDPTDPANATYWIDAGPTNRWKMFDLLRSTGTANAGSIVVTITPGERIDSVGLVGLVADSVTIEQKMGATVIWTDTVDLLNRPITNWFDYFFSGFRYRKEYARFDLRVDTGTTVTITITKATGNAVCGGVVLGMSVYLGRTLHDAESDALNFSKIDRDDFGNATLTPRRSVPKTTQSIRCKKSDVDRILQLRDDLNAAPALWSGLDDQDSGYFSALLIVGVYKRFTISMDQPEDALISLELEEV